MKNAIELKDIKKIYRTDAVQTTALNGVSLEVPEGDFLSIMGPSGCGKSTLLNLIGLIDSPDAGSYRFLGEEVAHLSEIKRSKLRKGNIGFVFQSFNLIDELSVFENVELPLLYLKVSKSERKAQVETVLTQMGMMHRKDHYPQQLSGGQQQRVAICRAIVPRPSIILADEPTGNLDSANGEEVMQALQQLNAAGTSIIMVTHSQHDADYAKNAINLFDGQIILEYDKKAMLKS